MRRKLLDRFKNQRGAVAVVVAILIIVLAGFAALAIDIGYAMVNKNELQNIADGAALAASRELGEIYPTLGPSGLVTDTAPLVAAAREISNNSSVAGDPISISADDVRVGHWDGAKFTATYDTPNAVNVTVRRDGAVNGPIATFLAGVMGVSSVNVTATATASLLNTLRMPSGAVRFPVGLSRSMFNDEYCGKSLAIYSTSLSNAPPDAGCGGWNTLQEPDNDAATLRDKILQGEIDGNYTSPELIADLSALNFTNGNDTTAFPKMLKLFDKMRVLNDEKLGDFDNDTATWTTVAPVYDSDICNPSGWIPIAGFASVTITGVDYPGHGADKDGNNGLKCIRMTINCNAVTGGVSGGVDFGAPGSIPNLVQ